MLQALACRSRVYRMLLEQDRALLERLAKQYEPAMVLVTSMLAAGDAVLGTPAHLEGMGFAILADLTNEPSRFRLVPRPDGTWKAEERPLPDGGE